MDYKPIRAHGATAFIVQVSSDTNSRLVAFTSPTIRAAPPTLFTMKAMISAAKMIARGNGDTVPLFGNAKTMSPQDRQRVVAADKHDRTQGVIMGGLRESAAGTDTERKAIERVNAREREPQRDEETGMKPEVSDEARKLAYEARNAQRLAMAARVAFGAEEAERVFGSDLRSRAAAFKAHMEVLGDLFFKDEGKHAEHENHGRPACLMSCWLVSACFVPLHRNVGSLLSCDHSPLL